MCGSNGPNGQDAAREGRYDGSRGSYDTNAFSNDSTLRNMYREAYEREQREKRQREGW